MIKEDLHWSPNPCTKLKVSEQSQLTMLNGNLKHLEQNKQLS